MMLIAFFDKGAGEFERIEMFKIDFDEAVARFPNEWSLNPPTKYTVIIDKVPLPIKIVDQKALPPPMVPRGGADLVPHRSRAA
jgi:hypothetical protein